MAAYYVSSSLGNDANDGSLVAPWKTVQKVSETIFAPGDMVFFRRGDVWRGTFRPAAHFGSVGAPVTYSWYSGGGSPPLPKFYNSIPKETTADWEYQGGNLWKTYMFEYATVLGPELLSNRSFESGSTGWEKFDSGGASSVWTVLPNPDRPGTNMAAFRVVTPGATANNIIFYSNAGFALEPYTVYKLSYYIRANDGFPDATIPAVALGQNVTPFYRLDEEQPTKPELSITSEFQLVERFIWTGKYLPGTLTPYDMSDCRLIFALGTLPAGYEFLLDELSLQKVGTAYPHYDTVPRDVGHIRRGSKLFPWKYLSTDEIDKMGGFVSDWDSWECFVASDTNPGEAGTELCMRWDNVLIRVDSMVLDGLELTYGGGNGFSLSNVSDVTIRNCTAHHLGGSYLYNTGSRAGLRQGNGVNIWETAINILVEDSLFWECYDVALTNQAYGAIDGGPSFTQSGITYRRNKIWACEQFYEVWGKDPLSLMENVTFEDNICLGAGYGWSRSVRDDPKGFCILQYDSECVVNNVQIINNIFGFWRDAYRFVQYPIGAGWTMDGNLLISRESDALLTQAIPVGDTYNVDTLYTLRTLPDYVTHTGFEATSTGEVADVPPEYGPGQDFATATTPGGYGSFKVTPPGGGADIWLVITPPTSPEFG